MTDTRRGIHAGKIERFLDELGRDTVRDRSQAAFFPGNTAACAGSGAATMSSEHRSDSEDAAEEERPNSGDSDKEEDPDLDDSDAEDEIAPTVSPSPPGSGGIRPERRARSAASEEPRCDPAASTAPQPGSGEAASAELRSGNSVFSWLQSRTIRRGVFVDPARDNFRTMTSLYCSMNPAAESVNLSTQTHGAVFNLEYSPDGSVLTVACEQTELNSKVCSLHGHASWVKNIEYDTNTKLLVTSGMRLTPDCSKMLISTSSGYLLILHDLDLTQSLETAARQRLGRQELLWTCVYEFQEGAPSRPLVSPRCSLRLTHYIEEANVGRGYIKELCFSPDGRLICSPYGYGVRLLAFDESCGELSDCLPVQTSVLREIRSLYSHSDVVLTTKFSPTHCQLASGCLSGRVALYQPKF
ncbi:hypothetical protein F7725_008605 [Dissostichus mawsoni]|uniref:DDB1- and CUL4-associated factor 10 n=1 Tax=Dissostichus mawsoni TaxID=36200 RepID=A0A7J5Y7M3_DISMA|nr:hypothetical protein F7725_008605 [Dissostichus mawsoni]